MTDYKIIARVIIKGNKVGCQATASKLHMKIDDLNKYLEDVGCQLVVEWIYP